MNARSMTSKLRRFGEGWHYASSHFYAYLSQTEDQLQYPVDVSLSPGSIITRGGDGSSWLVLSTQDRRLLQYAAVTRCRHAASVTRSDSTQRDTFGRLTAAEPVTVHQGVPLYLSDRQTTTANTQDRSGLLWRLSWQTSADFDIRVGDAIQTATLAATVTDCREVVPGLQEIQTIS